MLRLIKKLFKIGLYSIGGLFLLGFLIVACSDEEVKEEPKKEKQEEVKVVEKKEPKVVKGEEPKEEKKEVKKVAKPKVDYKPAVLEFEKELLSLDKNFEPLWNDLETALNNNDRFGAYDASTKAHKEAKSIWLAYGKLKADSDLPKNVRRKLNDASNDLQLAYYMKKEALESMQKYLDDNKPSDLQKVKEDSNASQAYMLQGAAKLTEAKLAVGIK